jgi:hypothetical protein
MKTIAASWTAYTHFDIPDDVAQYLESKPWGPNPEAIGFWRIRHNTLYYNDKEGKEQEIEGRDLEVRLKHPETIEEEGEMLYEYEY